MSGVDFSEQLATGAAQLEALEQLVQAQTIRIVALESNLASHTHKPGAAADPTQLTAPLSAQKTEKVSRSTTPPQVLDDFAKGLSQNQLAARLKCNVRSLMQRRDDASGLAAYTRGKDPDGVAWEFRDGRYWLFGTRITA